MKRTALLVLLVAFVAVAAWAAFSYAQGIGPFTWASGATAAQPTGMPAGPPDKPCHDVTTDSCGKACPDFRDTNHDGACDAGCTCDRHTLEGCSQGAARKCGGHSGENSGCWHE